MRFVLILALVAFVHASTSPGGGTRTQLRNAIKRGTNGKDCSYQAPNMPVGIESIGNSGQVLFYRMVNKTRRGRVTNTQVRRWLAILPLALREVNTNGATVRRAGGFSSTGTDITWTCDVGVETGLDANGNAISADVLESDWSASRDVFTGISGGTAQTQKVELGFNVKMFTQPWVIDMCPRKKNATGFAPSAFWVNHTNCSAVEVPGVGLKWAFLIKNWPYRDPANHLELRIQLRSSNKLSKANSARRAARILRRRQQIARQIVDFGDGFLDNPEVVQEMCDSGTTDRPLTIRTSLDQRTGRMDVYYEFPTQTAGCDFYYDPVMNSTQEGGTSGVERISVSFGLALFVVMYAVVIG